MVTLKLTSERKTDILNVKNNGPTSLNISLKLTFVLALTVDVVWFLLVQGQTPILAVFLKFCSIYKFPLMRNRKVPEQFTLYFNNVVILTHNCKVV